MCSRSSQLDLIAALLETTHSQSSRPEFCSPESCPHHSPIRGGSISFNNGQEPTLAEALCKAQIEPENVDVRGRGTLPRRIPSIAPRCGSASIPQIRLGRASAALIVQDRGAIPNAAPASRTSASTSYSSSSSLAAKAFARSSSNA